MVYNLLEEKWIPVLWNNGKLCRVGIKDALIQAGNIRQIAATNPMDRLAILRFLLALLYWCRGNPTNDAIFNISGSFPAEWFSKLDDNKDLFNLLGNGGRFYQDCDAHRKRAVTDLLQEIPTGNNFWHFRHSTDEKNGLCLACCAMGLLRLPLFSVSGLPDLKSGINGTPPVYVVPWGKTLLETIRVNWLPCENLGIPAWVHPDIRTTPGQDVPLLTGLTLLSRRVFLHEPVKQPRVCIGCGTRETPVILTCEFQTAGEQKNESWNDPHVVYTNSTPRKAHKAVDLTAAGKFRMDRPYTNLLTRIMELGKFGSWGNVEALLVVGFATDKAKNIDVWERTIVIPLVKPIQTMAATLLQQWWKENGRLEKRMGRSKVEGPSAIAAIRPHIEDKVSAIAGELISGGNDAWEKAAHEYQPMMEMIAKSISPGFTTVALQRRQEITRIVPDIRPTTEAAKKPRRKKGADK